MLIADIDWDKAIYIGNGSYGVIYEVASEIAPTLVVKISPRITRNEIDAQKHFAKKEKALAVLDYTQNVRLPASFHLSVCSIHGKTSAWEGDGCTCKNTVDIMLMPKVYMPVLKSDELDRFMNMIYEECYEELGRVWDWSKRNVAIHNDHFVALDFGDPDDTWD